MLDIFYKMLFIFFNLKNLAIFIFVSAVYIYNLNSRKASDHSFYKKSDND